MNRNGSLVWAASFVFTGIGIWSTPYAHGQETPPRGDGPKEVKADPARVAALVKQLGAEAFDVREAAKKALMDLPGSALETVRIELQKYPDDLEIKLSGEQIIKVLAERAFWEKAPKEMTNSIGIKHVLIPAGEFLMGSPEGEKDRTKNEGPQHNVKITKAFYMSTTEVTQAQWKAMMGTNRSQFKGDDLPVENVSWNDCQEFLKKLSEKDGKTYRLPTEAEWEYACRAGSTTRFHFGDDEGKLGEYAWYRGNSDEKTHAVGTKKPNAWGLYDMHGNVLEWCQDWYGKYAQEAVTDPTGPAQGADRVLRGGDWSVSPRNCRLACRGGVNPDDRYIGNELSFGFRVVLVYSSRTPP